MSLFVIVLRRPIWIGQYKGVPISFLRDIQNVLFERIQHSFHESFQAAHDSRTEVSIQAFPLQFSSEEKRLITRLPKEIHQRILKILEIRKCTFEETIKFSPGINVDKIHKALRNYRT
ncbi:MAG: hypothetical protein ACFFCQ_09845 [Promethearchaeota archaeon]